RQHDTTTAFRWLIQVARSLHRRNETVLRPDPSWVIADKTWLKSLPAEHSAYLTTSVLPVTTVLISLPFLWLLGRHLGPVGILIGLAIFVRQADEILPAAARSPAAARWRCWRWTPLALLVTATGIMLAEASAVLAGEASSVVRTVTVAVFMLGA